MKYIIPDKLYTVLKWLVLIALPAVATLVSALCAAWGVDASLAQAVVTTVTAVATFGGALLGVSAATAKPVEFEDGEDLSDGEGE